MGLFALPLYDDPIKNAEAAIANLKLYTTGEGGSYNLGFALACVEKAIEQEKLNDKRSRED
jgi:hypothetical protein